jgi:DNA polymerase-3 subunit epsilon
MSKILAFDLETTGVKFWKNGIHQISGKFVIDGNVVESFNFKVKPYKDAIIEDSALAVSGITKDDLDSYMEMKDCYNEFVAILSKYVDKFSKTDKFHLLGYNNASFDNQFLRAWFTQNATTEKEAQYGNYFGSWFWSDTIDVMVLASNKLKGKRHLMENFKQSTVAKYLGIEIDESKLHDALYDIEICLDIYNKVS